MTNSSKSVQEVLFLMENKSLRSTMLERMHLIEEADKLVTGLPQPVQLSFSICYIAEHVSLPIEDWDLLLGRIPEVIPDDQEENYIASWSKKCMYRPQWLSDYGHNTFAWDVLLEIGLGGLKKKAEAALATHMEAAPANAHDFLKSKAAIYQGFGTYIHRYGKAAKEKGMEHLWNICAHIATEPPQTFEEALQLILLVGQFYSAYLTMSAALGYGRLDQLLLPFYQRDIANNMLSKEQAASLIIDFNCKNNLILGRGEHQMGTAETVTGWMRNSCFDTPQYVILGGYTKDGGYKYNPLTELMLNQINVRFKNPVHVYRRTKEDIPALWDIACRKFRDNAALLIYNDETQIPAMRYAGITESDAYNYTIHACNWPDIAGKHHALVWHSVNLPERIMKAFIEHDFQSIDELYKLVGANYRKEMQDVFSQCRSGMHPSALTLLTSTECFMEGGAESIGQMMSGSISYPTIYNQLLYIATASDILSAIDTLLFQQHLCTLSQLREALTANFDGYESIRAYCQQAPKYGRDEEHADQHAICLLNLINGIAKEESFHEQDPIYCLNVTITDMTHFSAGMHIGATPDGRLRSEPLSENLSPSFGVQSKAVTSLLNSVSRLPFDHITAGALNVKMPKNCVSGEEGLERLKALLDVYFEQGGMQMQISVADTKELRDAQVHPENYRDLMVRITGYSAVFVDMSKNGQDEFIRRNELA